MPPPKKTYLRAPSLDYAPNTAIRLGHVFRRPTDPGSFIPGTPLPLSQEMHSHLNHTRKTGFTFSAGREKHGLVGAWLGFLEAVFGASIDAGVSWDRGAQSTFAFPVLDTYSVEPTPAYVAASVALAVEAGAVGRGENLYMVTGVKVARATADAVGGDGDGEGGGAAVGSGSIAVSESRLRGFGLTARVGVAEIPVGPEVEVSWSRCTGQAFDGSSDFVFAYRVREIFYEKGVLRTREYNKGALLGEGVGYTASGEGVDGDGWCVESAELGDEDVAVDGEVYSFLDDDGEGCDMII
ncbi:hypothetical protein C8A01DRAFT_38888 [Parachaetomium inaequale]|uniref:Uncharacterized protein n=1 Tax=Parachaetomium inaequale TaxID=2588326 RepID=A0AAN6PA78_9PEZI|nr:hypothetical protein C8A01DRAFT_38888 [Parachaetomium inaequale]